MRTYTPDIDRKWVFEQLTNNDLSAHFAAYSFVNGIKDPSVPVGVTPRTQTFNAADLLRIAEERRTYSYALNPETVRTALEAFVAAGVLTEDKLPPLPEEPKSGRDYVGEYPASGMSPPLTVAIR